MKHIQIFLKACMVVAALSLIGPRMSQAQAGEYRGANSTIQPSAGWPCGMAEGIPVPERGIPVFEVNLKLGQIYDVGRTPYGHRKVLVIQDGTFSGSKIKGTVMGGGLDFELSFSNGVMEVEQILVLKTDDAKYIYARIAGTAADASDVRIVPDFEAPNASAHSWLNTGKFVGRRSVDLSAKTMKLSVFDLSAVEAGSTGTNIVQIIKPAGVTNQPWDYRKAVPGEKRGEQLITETVTLGQSQSVGATKNGGRNIIPITGGTVAGKITGKVLFGGADYQKQANPFTLDARYLWQTDEGEVIIVRNAGPIASLVPTFETRLDGKYAFLNQGTYLSTGPNMGAGGVSLTFYESK